MICDSERDDFEQVIKDKSFDPNDFELTESRDKPTGTDVQPITWHVTIKRKSTGIEKIYKAGHFSSWPAEFDQDLQRGYFNWS